MCIKKDDINFVQVLIVQARSCLSGLFLSGEKISEKEATEREDRYELAGHGCYIYYNIQGNSGKFWLVK